MMQHRPRPCSLRHPHDRLAFTLIEMLAVIAILTFLLGTVTVLLSRFQHVASSDRRGLGDLVVRTSLARQIREDVHSSDTAQLLDDGAGLELTGAQDTVIYRWDSVGLMREISGRPTQLTRLPRWQISFNIEDGVVQLRGSRQSQQAGPPWTVDAAIGQTRSGGSP